MTVTDTATTAAPRTPAPTTASPTAATPTAATPTPAPTTASPTTATPTAATPTTATPTAATPTTASPTAATPTTASPTTDTPTAATPTTASPTAATPTTASPTTDTPTAATPTTDTPTAATPTAATPTAATPTAAAFDVCAARDAYMAELVDAGILIPTGVPGIHGRSALFEGVVEGIVAEVTRRSAADGAEVVRFPPVVTRDDYLRSGHLRTFPHLSGSVHAFVGDDRTHRELLRKVDAGERWTDDLEPTDVVLTPAACYPVYPMSTGKLSDDGRLFDIQSYCFRHEPSNDPMRMQMFRQHEHVRIGTADQVRDWRNVWFERSQEILADLRVPFAAEVANDPFFGRTGTFMAASQREQALKFEMNVAIIHPDHPTACVSLNMHEDHFGHEFAITLPDGSWASTSCIGFGLERLTLALLRTHGLDPSRWPADVRAVVRR